MPRFSSALPILLSSSILFSSARAGPLHHRALSRRHSGVNIFDWKFSLIERYPNHSERYEALCCDEKKESDPSFYSTCCKPLSSGETLDESCGYTQHASNATNSDNDGGEDDSSPSSGDDDGDCEGDDEPDTNTAPVESADNGENPSHGTQHGNTHHQSNDDTQESDDSSEDNSTQDNDDSGDDTQQSSPSTPLSHHPHTHQSGGDDSSPPPTDNNDESNGTPSDNSTQDNGDSGDDTQQSDSPPSPSHHNSGSPSGDDSSSPPADNSEDSNSTPPDNSPQPSDDDTQQSSPSQSSPTHHNSGGSQSDNSDQQTGSSDQGSGSGGGGSGETYSGTATWFEQDGNASACGGIETDDSMIVALDSRMFEGGAHCNQQVVITDKNNGQTVTATVADECPTCDSAGSIDMSLAVFAAFGETYDTGVFPITWHFA